MSDSSIGNHGRSKTPPARKKPVKKSLGRLVNKTEEIRNAARMLVVEGKPPRPKEIVAILKVAGITVSRSQVSTALARTEFAFRSNRDVWDRPKDITSEPALAFGQVSLDDVFEAREFAKKLGSVDRAIAALVALKQFGGEQATATEQTKSHTAADSRSSEKGRAMRLTS